ncbi:MAG: LacI family transcriptional regulator [Bifidobacteriaceae bacterium]|nr:LacI family transcriptional regulator [Bifidobacteriaceae bacterium]
MAKRAKVSRSTVSAILNGHGQRFPEDTQSRVKAAAEELNYHPSAAGRSLVKGRSDTLVLLIPNSTFGPNLQDSVDKIVDEVEGYIGNVVVRFSGKDQRRSLANIETMRPLAVISFGVTLSEEDYDRLERNGISVLPPRQFAHENGSMDGGVAALQLDAIAATIERDIWYASISDSRTDTFSPARLRSLKELCRRNNYKAPHEIAIHTNGAPAEKELKRILRVSSTANILCYNDDVAISLLAAARDTGVSVPGTITVVGVDNTFSGQLWSPRLTTINPRTSTFANYISSQLKELLEGKSLEQLPTSTWMSIVQGETTLQVS